MTPGQSTEPFEQFLAGYTITTPASGFGVNFVNVVAPNAAVGNITLDGTTIPADSFTAIGTSGFSGVQIPIALGAHWGECIPFVLNSTSQFRAPPPPDYGAL